MSELHDLTALETAAAIRTRETSPTEVVRHALDRAERLGPQVGAFVTLTPERALAEAAAAEKILAAADDPRQLPPLLGVPCPIKDLTMVAGVRFTAGSALLADNVAEVDDGVVTLLARAGTVMLGKTTTPELGLPCYTEPDGTPPARTPWDTSRTAGGSSGGAAAAVAARIVPVSHGNDGGGSIRIPASACGLVGLKPSRGLVSPGPWGTDGAGLTSNGVLTRDVRDTAALLDVLAVPWPGDLVEAQRPAGGFLAALDARPRRMRVGLLTTPLITADADVHPACLAAAEKAAADLAAFGHDVTQAPVPFPAHDWDAFVALWSVMALGAPVPPEAEGMLRPLTQWLRARGRSVSGIEHADAVLAQQRLVRAVGQAWDHLDVIVTPTLAQPPIRPDELRNDADPAEDFAAQTRFTPWTSVWNLTGRPAISVPLGEVTADGITLPVGVQLGGRLGRDADLLAVAAQLEEVHRWQDRRPALA
ncbi:amidase [Sanguibacter sp. A247]|uniref:amidase n=1 Tax=unclassified Sanguibacter TaxID=2645534 RepID=UPI003FD759B8